MYLCSVTLSQILLKNPLGKWFFKFWSRDNFRENLSFGHHFETVQSFIPHLSEPFLTRLPKGRGPSLDFRCKAYDSYDFGTGG